MKSQLMIHKASKPLTNFFLDHSNSIYKKQKFLKNLGDSSNELDKMARRLTTRVPKHIKSSKATSKRSRRTSVILLYQKMLSSKEVHSDPKISKSFRRMYTRDSQRTRNSLSIDDTPYRNLSSERFRNLVQRKSIIKKLSSQSVDRSKMNQRLLKKKENIMIMRSDMRSKSRIGGQTQRRKTERNSRRYRLSDSRISINGEYIERSTEGKFPQGLFKRVSKIEKIMNGTGERGRSRERSNTLNKSNILGHPSVSIRMLSKRRGLTRNFLFRTLICKMKMHEKS